MRHDVRILLAVLVAAAVVACQRTDAQRQDEPQDSPTKEWIDALQDVYRVEQEDVSPEEYREAWRRLQRLLPDDGQSDVREALALLPQTTEITKGGYEGLRIGASKTEALAALREVEDVSRIAPRVLDQVTVSTREDLHLLNDAEKVIAGAGGAGVVFSGDEVIETWASRPELAERLASASNRSEALEALAASVLDGPFGGTLRNTDTARRRVSIENPGTHGLGMLEKYDRWFILKNTEFGGALTLEFRDDRLNKIVVQRVAKMG